MKNIIWGYTKKLFKKSFLLSFIFLFQQQSSQGTNHHINNCQNLQSNTDVDDDVWRGHSIAALRRRASELNASSIPSYLHSHSYEHHNSVY